MFEWLAAAATSVVLGSSSTPGMMDRLKPKNLNRPPVKERTYKSVDIACVAAAVAAREAALSSGASTHGTAVANAYSTRATALANAYALTGGNAAIRDAVKKAWDSFRSSIQTARKSWQTARDGAWKQFQTAVKNCKASTEVLDTANTASEPKGE